jgi:dTDP-4-amino-4,6-dideoxygalactose transaminase
MLDTPFSPWPSFTQEEADVVARVLLSNRVNYWTGTECHEFEREFAAWAGAKHAIAMANGTLALEAALKGLGIGPGDDVVVTPRSFLASAACVVNVGARPIFADVDADSQNITAVTIERVLTSKTRAIVCVHLAGMPCDMDPIMALARARGVKVIEDCAQAHGAKYRGLPVGGIGHVGAWSFCQDKIITTGGEGGMVTTNDPAAWSRMWSLKDHGKSWEAVHRREHPPGFRWVSESFGSNWRMTEMQAAIGRIQLRRLPQWSAHRAANAQRLAAACSQHAVVRVPLISDDVVHAHYRFYAFVRPELLAPGWTRDRIVEAIVARDVPCFQGSCGEVYVEKAFDGTGWRPREPLPVAHELGETSLALLVHPTLTEAEITRTCSVISEVLSMASA